VTASGVRDSVLLDVVGVTFELGIATSILPPVSDDKLLVPPPYELRILPKPRNRVAKVHSGKFKLLTVVPAAAVCTSEGLQPLSESEGLTLSRRTSTTSPAAALGAAGSLSLPLGAGAAGSKTAVVGTASRQETPRKPSTDRPTSAAGGATEG
jgi:hypothetical protein